MTSLLLNRSTQPAAWDDQRAMARLAEMLFEVEIAAYSATVTASQNGFSGAPLREPVSPPDITDWIAAALPDGSWRVDTGESVYLVFEDDRQPVQLQTEPRQ